MTEAFPVLPLRDIVVFPQMIVPLFVGRDKSVAALESAMANDKTIFLVSQLDPSEDDPDADALYDIGVTATVLQLLKLPDGTVRVLVEGKQRARMTALNTSGDHLTAEIALLGDGDLGDLESQAAEMRTQIKALMRSVVEQFERYAQLNRKLPDELPTQLAEIEDPARLADAVAGNISVKVSDKQAMLVEQDPSKRLEMAFAFMEGELGALQVEKRSAVGSSARWRRPSANITSTSS